MLREDGFLEIVDECEIADSLLGVADARERSGVEAVSIGIGSRDGEAWFEKNDGEGRRVSGQAARL